jgi:hypothetical protein
VGRRFRAAAELSLGVVCGQRVSILRGIRHLVFASKRRPEGRRQRGSAAPQKPHFPKSRIHARLPDSFHP